MRKLAYVAFSFSGAVFAANCLLPEAAWLPAGLGLAALFAVLLRRYQRRRSRRGLAALLLCAGLAAGVLWTGLYSAVFFQPARELDGRTVRIEATVSGYPQQTEYGYSISARVETRGLVRLSAVLYGDERFLELRPGDRIATVAHCTLGDRTFSGEEITYYVAKGIFLRAETYGSLEVERPEGFPLWWWAPILGEKLKGSIDAAFPAGEAALVRAVVTGNRDNLTDEYTAALQRTGLAHTVAVSGMHLAFLAGLLSLVMGRGRRRTAIVTLVGVVLFCGVAGNTPSVLRAAVMVTLLELAPLVEREPDEITSLGTALMLLLAWNPFSAAHVGLQLSFASVTGLFLFSQPLQGWLMERLGLNRRPKNWLLRQLIKIPRLLVSALAATLGASAATLPLAALYFQSIPLISPLSNLLTLWAVALLFSGGLAVGVLGLFSPGLAGAAAVPLGVLARYLLWVVDLLGRVPLASIPLNSRYYRLWALFLCLLLGWTVRERGRKRPVLPVCCGIVLLLLALRLTASTLPSGELEAAVLDVGQGQSVLLRLGQNLVLVDCGGDGEDNPGDTAADYIQSLGRSRLDVLVISHFHTDHANGIGQLLRRIEVSEIVLPDVEEDDGLRHRILEQAEERGIRVRLVSRDMVYTFGENQRCLVYAPLGQGEETNELGLTVLATSGDFDVLIPGDMGGELELELLSHAALPDIELLVAGHHGSRYSTTQELLEAVKPEAAVISVGKDNGYGHPAQQTLERLARAGVEIYRTDLQGTVMVRSGE